MSQQTQFSSAPADIGETGPQTDLSTQNQPAGTTGIDDGVAHSVSGAPTGAANLTPPATKDPWAAPGIVAAPAPVQKASNPTPASDPWAAPGITPAPTPEPSFMHKAYDTVVGAAKAENQFEKDVAMGAVKGLGDTFLGASQLMNRTLRYAAEKAGAQAGQKGVNGVAVGLDRWLPGLNDPETVIKGLTGDLNATLEGHGIGQNVGKVAETIAEFMMGDEVLKGLSYADKLAKYTKAVKVLQEYPRLGPIVSRAMQIGIHAAQSGAEFGTFSGLQDYVKTGGANPQQSIEAAKSGALYGGLGTAAVETAAPTILKPAAQKLFAWINAPKSLEAAEEALQATRVGSVDTIPALGKSVFPGNAMEGSELAQKVQDDLKAAFEKKSTDYEAARAVVTADVDAAQKAGTEIKVGGKGSPIQLQADKFANAPSGLPAGFEDVFDKTRPGSDPRIAPLLKKFADETTQPMTWDEAETIRQQIGEAVRNTSDGDPIKWRWIEMRNAMDESMEKAAQDAGMPEIAKDMQTLRSNYAEANNALTKNFVMKSLRNKDLDSVAAALMNGNQVEKNVETLRKTLASVGGDFTMQDVERSLFQRLVDKSTSVGSDGNRTVNPNKLAQQFSALSPDVRSAFWGKNADEVEKVVNAYKAQIEADLKDVADAKKSVADVNSSIFSPNNPIARWLGGHAAGIAGSPFMFNAFHKAQNGDISGAIEDAFYGLAVGIAASGAQRGAGKILGNPEVQSKILSFIEFLSHASESRPLKGQFGAEAGAATPKKLETGNISAGRPLAEGEFHAGVPFGNPSGETAAGEMNVAQTGLPENSRITLNETPSNEEFDLTKEANKIGDLVEWETGARPTENTNLAKATSPAPSTDQPVSASKPAAKPSAGERLTSVLNKLTTETKSPMERRALNELNQKYHFLYNPNRVLEIDTTGMGPQMLENVRRLQTAHFADIAKGNPDLALAVRRALDAESKK